VCLSEPIIYKDAPDKTAPEYFLLKKYMHRIYDEMAAASYSSKKGFGAIRKLAQAAKRLLMLVSAGALTQPLVSFEDFVLLLFFVLNKKQRCTRNISY